MLAPEVFEPRRRQLSVADSVLNRAMAKPILQCPGIVAGIGQCIAACMAQHVAVDREGEASALADALYKMIDSVRRKGPAPLGRKHKTTIGKLPCKAPLPALSRRDMRRTP
jgi:hypothetical protein